MSSAVEEQIQSELRRPQTGAERAQLLLALAILQLVEALTPGAKEGE